MSPILTIPTGTGVTSSVAPAASTGGASYIMPAQSGAQQASGGSSGERREHRLTRAKRGTSSR